MADAAVKWDGAFGGIRVDGEWPDRLPSKLRAFDGYGLPIVDNFIAVVPGIWMR
jgi:hypothetical protein